MAAQSRGGRGSHRSEGERVNDRRSSPSARASRTWPGARDEAALFIARAPPRPSRARRPRPRGQRRRHPSGQDLARRAFPDLDTAVGGGRHERVGGIAQGDTLHNFSDALTALPLWLAFSLSRRPRNDRYTYGYGRAEDLAGIFVVLAITVSAAIAG
ncbi:MAG: cation transporter, partial [Actinomycetota bacterium]